MKRNSTVSTVYGGKWRVIFDRGNESELELLTKNGKGTGEVTWFSNKSIITKKDERYKEFLNKKYDGD